MIKEICFFSVDSLENKVIIIFHQVAIREEKREHLNHKRYLRSTNEVIARVLLPAKTLKSKVLYPRTPKRMFFGGYLLHKSNQKAILIDS